MSKVSIIGAGEVGASCATCLADRDFVNEIVIVDVKPGLAEGKALDLRKSAALRRFDTIVKGYTADYSKTAYDIQALILGGHGKSMVPMPRYTTIGGIPIRNLLSEDKVQEVIHRTQLGGEEIINYLGRSGWFAAGAAVCEMVEAVICDQRRVFAASDYLNGEYGYNDICLGVPVILGGKGVESIIELELDDDDKHRFETSKVELNLYIIKNAV